MAQDDFQFACEGVTGQGGAWGALRVVRFEGTETISAPFRYEVFVLAGRGTPDVDPDAVIGARATLRIATKSQPAFKVVHGVVAEMDDVKDVPEGSVYRVVLVPPWARTQHQIRCRIFLDLTLRQIVDAVLGGDPLMQLAAGGAVEEDDGGPGFAPAREAYTWRIADPSRVDDARVRAYCVQYNESDFAFVSRLLEEEGVAYHFEHGSEKALLVLSDSDTGRARLAAPIGKSHLAREVEAFRVGGRLRTSSVVFDDYDWKKPSLDLTARADAGSISAGLEAYHYPGAYPDSAGQGHLLAQVVADLHKTQAEFAQAEGPLRVLSAGAIFELDHAKERFVGEYLVAELRVVGEQSGVSSVHVGQPLGKPFHATVDLARRGRAGKPAESRFRPAAITARPRIHGAQTAFVTNDPSTAGSEVNVGGPDAIDVGCVRVKFHWDSEHLRHGKQATSCWVRVNQPFAGPGQGGVWHAQVGTEVIVEFEEGNPDRPIITGRLYNGANLPAHGGAPNISTLMSQSTPGHGVKNEFTFDDTAGAELLYQNAGKDMTVDVGNDREEHVAVSASMTVGADNGEHIGASNTDTIGADDALTCGGHQTKDIGADRTRVIGASRTKIVGASETRTIAAHHSNDVTATLTETAGDAVTETYSSTMTTNITSSYTLACGASRSTTVAGAVVQVYGGDQTIDVGAARTVTVNGFEGSLIGGDVTNDFGTWTLNVAGPMIGLVAGNVEHHFESSFSINAPLKLHIIALKKETFGERNQWIGLGLNLVGIWAEATTQRMMAVGANLAASDMSVLISGLRVEQGALEAEECAADICIGFHIFI